MIFLLFRFETGAIVCMQRAATGRLELALHESGARSARANAQEAARLGGPLEFEARVASFCIATTGEPRIRIVLARRVGFKSDFVASGGGGGGSCNWSCCCCCWLGSGNGAKLACGASLRRPTSLRWDQVAN